MSINPTYLRDHERRQHHQSLNWTETKPTLNVSPAPGNVGGGMFSALSKTSLKPTAMASKLRSLTNKLPGASGDKPRPTEEPRKKKKSQTDSGSQSEDDLLTGLFKIFLAALALPGKFEGMFNGVTNATLSLATGIEGLSRSLYVGIEDLVYLVIVIFTIVSKYMNCFISFLVNLPSCFISHVISFVFSVLYLIFPLTAWIFRMLTGFDLMPHFDKAFEAISDGDDVLATYTGFNFLKFPPSIIKQCYTCNGKVVKLRDILVDVSQIKEVGDKISYDMTKTVPRLMKPAMPYIYKTADALDQVFFQ